MFPSALTNRGRIARLAELLGADPDLVHTPYDLDRLTLSRFSTDRPEETAQALAALRDEVDEAFAAAVRPASDGSDPDSLGGANLSYS